MKITTDLTILYLLCCPLFLSCNDKEKINPRIVVFEDKIECGNCYDFGSIIEADENDLIVADYQSIYFFEWQNQELIHTKTLNFNNTSGIQDMLLKNDTLLFGLADAEGTGTVYIYDKRIEDWGKIQELTIGRHQDNFGCAIDVDGIYLIIGANAPWTDNIETWNNTDEGRIYIYKKTTTTWELENEFRSIHISGNDNFGKTVSIYGNYILTGSDMLPLHIYRYNGEWKLDGIRQIEPGKIIHEGNHFLIRNTAYTDNELISFLLIEDGSFEYHENTYKSTMGEISGHGEILEIHKNYAVIDFEGEYKCHLFEFDGTTWRNIREFQSPEGIKCQFSGLEITDNTLYLGGADDMNNGMAYVYFFDF